MSKRYRIGFIAPMVVGCICMLCICPAVWGQNAKLLRTLTFTSIEMKEGNEKSLVPGKVDVYYWTTYQGDEKPASGNFPIEATSKINIQLTNFRWDRLRWGLGRTSIAYQGNRFSRENAAFRLEKLIVGKEEVEKDQAVFMPVATNSDPGKIEFLISPKIAEPCTTGLRLRLKFYAIKKANMEEGGTFDKVTEADLVLEVPFDLLPPASQEVEKWEEIVALEEDIFGQTAALQQYLANFADCGQHAADAKRQLMANEDRLCDRLDANSAKSYLRLYQKLGWEGSCLAKAQSLAGDLEEEDFFGEAMKSKRLRPVCAYLNTFGQQEAALEQVRQVQTHLNALIKRRWEVQFGNERPQAERDREACSRFLTYLNQCPSRVMDTYIDSYNAGKRWLARVCVRTADRCAILWEDIQNAGSEEEKIRLQRAYCDACNQAQNQARYLEILQAVKAKVSPLPAQSAVAGWQAYAFQIAYFAPQLSLAAIYQQLSPQDSATEIRSQVQFLNPSDSFSPESEQIYLQFSTPHTLHIWIPAGVQGNFQLQLLDSLEKAIDLEIDTRLRPLRAELQEGWFEGEYRLRLGITGGDSLLANGKSAYRLILNRFDDPGVSYAFGMDEIVPDEKGLFVINKEKNWSNIPDGAYQVTIRDGRNDETHEVVLRRIVSIKHGGEIPINLLKAALALLLLGMVAWLTYANIRVARKAKKK